MSGRVNQNALRLWCAAGERPANPVFTIEADEYTVDSDSLTLNEDDDGAVASFAAGHWVAIEKLPD